MLLALWPLFIAMPETANYALLDQQKRDERRLSKKKKQIDDELAARRLNVSADDVSTDGRMVNPVYAIFGNITERSITDGILGHGADGIADVRGLPVVAGASPTEINAQLSGTDKAMKRRNEEDLFLLLASL